MKVNKTWPNIADVPELVEFLESFSVIDDKKSDRSEESLC